VASGTAESVSFGFKGAGGTTNSASLDESSAITLGKALAWGGGACAASAPTGVALVSAFGFGLVFSLAFRLATTGAVPVGFLEAEPGLALGALREVFAGGVAFAAFCFVLAFALGELRGEVAGAPPFATFGRGVAFSLGALRGTLDVTGRVGSASGGLNVTFAGPLAAAGAVKGGGNGKGGDSPPDCRLAGLAGASTARRFGASARLSCQGRAKPGNPNS